MLEQTYSHFYEQLKAISTRYENIEQQAESSHEQDELFRSRRMENLRQQLKKIDEYSEKVEYFRHLAEKNLSSRNLLTITPRELNFNRMRNWAMMIDPTAEDDPYAQRIYVQAKCNEMFLQIKRREFESTLAALENNEATMDEGQKAQVEQLQRQLVEECRVLLESDAFAQFAAELSERHKTYADAGTVQPIADPETAEGMVGLGGCARSLPVLETLRYMAKAKLGEYYDAKSSSVLLPVECSLEREILISVACAAAKEKRLYRGIQNLFLNILTRTKIGRRKIYFLDALHFNTSALGALRPLENSVVLQPVPRDAEQIVDTLKQIVSGFSDVDEALGMAESVQEFNASVAPEDQLERSIVALLGYPSAFSGEAKNYIKRILLNYEHYGITPILLDTQYVGRREAGATEDVTDTLEGVCRIQMTQQRELIRKDSEPERHFRWYELNQEISASYLELIRSYDSRTDVLGTEYVKRVDMEHYPAYERGKKSIVLPYGVDARDTVHSISFDNENFASYLMGASGSGKSTLLHTLITGILRDYHPDDVELWLADFKMSEFAQYMDPLPPHVKYILLDESPELVYDLLDQLTEKMMERQRFFMQHRDMKKVENVPKNIYMPVIFVILDEFSIMSQAVSESEVYKLRLQNLLAKGRALGIKFIFSSQTFTKGVAGLTQTAKDQIQSRIAMKNSYNEINETLELSSGIRTEQVKNWMEALPPHYALCKYRDGDALHVKRLQVMYFKGKGEEALEPQRKLIRHLNHTLKPIELSEYDSENAQTYVNKHPVIVDGNSYKGFSKPRIQEMLIHHRKDHADELSDDDVLAIFGAPRRMANAKFATITNESRENLLLIARSAEQSCGMSVILSAMEAFQMQGGDVQIWAYGKNRLYRAYKESHFLSYNVAEGLPEICGAIKELRRKIAEKENGNSLIVLLGMEQICSDFELIDFGGSNFTFGNDRPEVNVAALAVQSEEEQRDYNEMLDLRTRFEEEYDLDELENEWLEQGRPLDEIMQEEERLYQDFLQKQGALPDESELVEPVDAEWEEAVKEEPIVDEPEGDGSYNALEDFKYLVKQGSRFGYHFMLCLNNLSDIRNTQLQAELFRHKLVFQLSAEDSTNLFLNRSASNLPEHICQYSDTLEQYSFRPFIHEGVSWDGWILDADGNAMNSF